MDLISWRDKYKVREKTILCYSRKWMMENTVEDNKSMMTTVAVGS